MSVKNTCCIILCLCLSISLVTCNCQWSAWSLEPQTCRWKSNLSCRLVFTRICNCQGGQCSLNGSFIKYSHLSCPSLDMCPHLYDYDEWSYWSAWSSCPEKRQRYRKCVRKRSYTNVKLRRCFDDNFETDTRESDYCRTSNQRDNNIDELAKSTPIKAYIIVGVVVLVGIAGCCCCCKRFTKSSGTEIRNMSTYSPAPQLPASHPAPEVQMSVYHSSVTPSAPAPVPQYTMPTPEQHEFDLPPPSYEEVMKNEEQYS